MAKKRNGEEKIVFLKMMIVDGRLGCVSLSFGDKFFSPATALFLYLCFWRNHWLDKDFLFLSLTFPLLSCINSIEHLTHRVRTQRLWNTTLQQQKK